jgi:hypothetical protein
MRRNRVQRRALADIEQVVTIVIDVVLEVR